MPAAAPLLVETATRLVPGSALDLACGTGRNALWLADRGWAVTAIDGSASAIDVLSGRAVERGLTVCAQVADLEKGQYRIGLAAWDLIAMCYYLQRDLFDAAKQGMAPGGLILAIVHLAESGEKPTAHRLQPGELRDYFRDWEIIHSYEGQPNDPTHRRLVAEIVARCPENVSAR